MKRFAQGSKDIVKLQGGKVRAVEGANTELLNERSVADLTRIKSTMETNKVKIDDLQFLIGKDGSVAIADPLKVTVGESPSANNKRMIDLLIKAARENIAKP
jgi:hypothetical protein